jgi:hypothetical protein
LLRWIKLMAPLPLLMTFAASARVSPISSMHAALDRGVAVAAERGGSVRCTRDRKKLAFSCIEQLDKDHFTSVDVVAEPIAPDKRRPGRRSVQAGDPIFGPGGGGGRYSMTTADGAYAIHATEFQRLVRGARPKLPSATRLLEVVVATYDGRPANR